MTTWLSTSARRTFDPRQGRIKKLGLFRRWLAIAPSARRQTERQLIIILGKDIAAQDGHYRSVAARRRISLASPCSKGPSICGGGRRFVDRDILIRTKRREHGLAMGLYVSRAAISFTQIRTGVTLILARACRRLSLAGLTPARPAASRCEAPVATGARTKILRSTDRAFIISFGLPAADSSKQFLTDLGIPRDSA